MEIDEETDSSSLENDDTDKEKDGEGTHKGSKKFQVSKISEDSQPPHLFRRILNFFLFSKPSQQKSLDPNGQRTKLLLPNLDVSTIKKNPKLAKEIYDMVCLVAETAEEQKNALQEGYHNLEIHSKIQEVVNENLKQENKDLRKSSRAGLYMSSLGIPASIITGFGINYVTSDIKAWYGWVCIIFGMLITIFGILLYVQIVYLDKNERKDDSSK